MRLSLRKAAYSSMVPPISAGNPGSVYTNCETASVVLHLMQRRGRPIGGFRSPVSERMEDTSETPNLPRWLSEPAEKVPLAGATIRHRQLLERKGLAVIFSKTGPTSPDRAESGIAIADRNQSLNDCEDHRRRNPKQERSVCRLDRSQHPPFGAHHDVSIAERRVIHGGMVKCRSKVPKLSAHHEKDRPQVDLDHVRITACSIPGTVTSMPNSGLPVTTECVSTRCATCR